MHNTSDDRLTEKAVIVGVKVYPTSDYEFQESLEELSSLVTSAGARVVARVTQHVAFLEPPPDSFRVSCVIVLKIILEVLTHF